MIINSRSIVKLQAQLNRPSDNCRCNSWPMWPVKLYWLISCPEAFDAFRLLELFAVSCCACYTGETTFEVKTEIKTEADVSDDKPRPYLCTVCDKRFTRKDHLTRHRELHTGVMYTCSQCEKVFSSQNSLQHHMNIHTNKYKCSVCGKCCGTSQNLAEHRRRHSGDFSVLFAARDLQNHMTLLYTAEFTVERNHTNVTYVIRFLVRLHIWSITWESTRVTNHTNVHCVTKVLLSPAPCSYINVVYTVTVDHMNVLSVGNCLRQT